MTHQFAPAGTAVPGASPGAAPDTAEQPRLNAAEFDRLARRLALIAARSPTGRAQARLEGGDSAGLAALAAGIATAAGSFGAASVGEQVVHPVPSAGGQVDVALGSNHQPRRTRP